MVRVGRQGIRIQRGKQNNSLARTVRIFSVLGDNSSNWRGTSPVQDEKNGTADSGRSSIPAITTFLNSLPISTSGGTVSTLQIRISGSLEASDNDDDDGG